jgi:hypothetical protein
MSMGGLSLQLSRSCAGAHRSADEGVAQTVFVFHEFHAVNVLLLKGLFACGLLVRDRCVGDIHESSGVFLRGYVEDLDLLPRLQAAQIRAVFPSSFYSTQSMCLGRHCVTCTNVWSRLRNLYLRVFSLKSFLHNSSQSICKCHVQQAVGHNRIQSHFGVGCLHFWG